MTTSDIQEIQRFKDRLLNKKTARLMQQGGKNLSPVPAVANRPGEKPVISPGRVVHFFLEWINTGKIVTPDEYITGLYHLLLIFTKGLSECEILSEPGFSEKKIQSADNRTAVVYLTTNIIIVFFNNIIQSDGKTDHCLLDKNLTRLRGISTAGRDCQLLADGAVEKLGTDLIKETTWQACLEKLNDVRLVCMLSAMHTPVIAPRIFQGTIKTARHEIEKAAGLLFKLLQAKNDAIRQQGNPNNIQKSIKKLDAAIDQTTEKLNSYVFYLNRFKYTPGLFPMSFKEKFNFILKKIMIRLIFGSTVSKIPESSAMNHSRLLARLKRLSKYNEVLEYSSRFKKDEDFSPCYLILFKIFFNHMAGLFDQVAGRPEVLKTNRLTHELGELVKIAEILKLSPKEMITQKQLLEDRFFILIKSVPLDQLADVLCLRDNLCRILQKDNRLFDGSIGENLLSACFSRVKMVETKGRKMESIETELEKHLYAYAAYYRPKKFFFQHFFEIYLGRLKQGPAQHLKQLAAKRTDLAFSLLRLYARPEAADRLVPGEYSSFSNQLIQSLPRGNAP